MQEKREWEKQKNNFSTSFVLFFLERGKKRGPLLLLTEADGRGQQQQERWPPLPTSSTPFGNEDEENSNHFSLSHERNYKWERIPARIASLAKRSLRACGSFSSRTRLLFRQCGETTTTSFVLGFALPQFKQTEVIPLTPYTIDTTHHYAIGKFRDVLPLSRLVS